MVDLLKDGLNQADILGFSPKGNPFLENTLSPEELNSMAESIMKEHGSVIDRSGARILAVEKHLAAKLNLDVLLEGGIPVWTVRQSDPHVAAADCLPFPREIAEIERKRRDRVVAYFNYKRT